MSTPLIQPIQVAHDQIRKNIDTLQELVSESKDVSHEIKEILSDIKIQLCEGFRLFQQMQQQTISLKTRVSWCFDTFEFFSQLHAVIRSICERAKLPMPEELPPINVDYILEFVFSVRESEKLTEKLAKTSSKSLTEGTVPSLSLRGLFQKRSKEGPPSGSSEPPLSQQEIRV